MGSTWYVGESLASPELIAADVIDEYHFQLIPTAVGGGRPSLPTLRSYATFKRVNVQLFGAAVVFLHYEPQR